MLFLEFHGSPSAVQEQVETVQAIAGDQQAEGFEWATQPEERTRLWNARHLAFFACLQLKPGSRGFTTDACVPISRLADCVEQTLEDLRQSSLPCPLFGHVGDGNFHCVILADPTKPEEMAEAERLNVDPCPLAGHVLAACAASISDVWRVKPKRHDHWTQQARIWTCVVKEVGARGTEIIRSAFWPMRSIRPMRCSMRIGFHGRS